MAAMKLVKDIKKVEVEKEKNEGRESGVEKEAVPSRQESVSSGRETVGSVSGSRLSLQSQLSLTQTSKDIKTEEVEKEKNEGREERGVEKEVVSSRQETVRKESMSSGRETVGSLSGSRLSLQSQLSLSTMNRREEEGRETKEVEKEMTEDGEDRGVEKEAELSRQENGSSGRETVGSLSGSRLSLQSQPSLSRMNDRKQSQGSLRSAGRTGSKQSLLSIDDLPRPSPRGNKKIPAIGRLHEPSKLRDWYHGKSKGCFFVDESKGFVSHQYQLTLTEDTSIWLTIQPLKIGDSMEKGLVDTAVYILRDDRDDDDNLITFTEQRDSKGCHGVRCDLTAGTYTLLPFTTGCRLRPRKSEPPREARLISKDKQQDKIELTRNFKKALEEIFEMSDLDGNGLLSREEFNWFNIRTSDEQVADDEWQVVEENVELAAGEITKRGFITLNEMEAQDNDGDTEDLWITLNNMGYNKALEMDEACPFLINVYAEDGEVILKVTELENPGKMLENAVCASVISKGESSRVKAMKDLTLYTYMGDARATIVVENKSRTKVTMEMDCSRSRNCLISSDSFVSTITVPGHAKKVAVHMVPEKEREEWSVQCAETILK